MKHDFQHFEEYHNGMLFSWKNFYKAIVYNIHCFFISVYVPENDF